MEEEGERTGGEGRREEGERERESMVTVTLGGYFTHFPGGRVSLWWRSCLWLVPRQSTV